MALIEDGFSALTDIRVALGGGDEIGCHVFLNAPRTRERKDEWFRVHLDGVLAGRFVDGARSVLADIETRAADEQSLAEFDFDAMAAGSIGLLRVVDAPAIGDWINALPADDWPVAYAGDESVLEKARFYATRINFPDGRMLRLFRGRRGINLMLKSKGAAAMFQRDRQELAPVEGSIVSFDLEIDFFEWEGLIFIVKLLTFESLTNLREVTARKAFTAIDALSERFHLDDVEQLKEEIGKRTRLAKKLAAVAQHGLVRDIIPDALIARIAEKQLSIRCRLDAGQCVFDVDHSRREQVEDFVNLVSDFYLHSSVTGREWEAVVKRVPRTTRRPAL